MSFIFNNSNFPMIYEASKRCFFSVRQWVVMGVAIMMLLSTGGNLLIEESEAERPVKEKQEEEGESMEVFVRHSKPRKVQFSVAITFPVVTPPPCCYQYQTVIQGHQLEHGLASPLLC